MSVPTAEKWYGGRISRDDRPPLKRILRATNTKPKRQPLKEFHDDHDNRVAAYIGVGIE